MTNREKFAEVFGIKIDAEFSLCLMISDCEKCSLYGLKNCTEYAKQFWGCEYNEPDKASD